MSDDEHDRERDPRPGERCECGRPAVTVFITEKFGDVPYCGFPDGGQPEREPRADDQLRLSC